MTISKPNISLLHQRAQLLKELRLFFDDRGFLEVQPPCLARDCVADPYIDPLSVGGQLLALADPQLPEKLYLQTSPELSMKRMLAAGAPSIYAITPAFRAGESGDMHNSEFTMLEWYEVGADAQAGIALLGQLATGMLATDGFDVMSYRDLIEQNTGFDPIDVDLDTLQQSVATDHPQLAATTGDDRDGLLDILISHHIQPDLGKERPIIISDYPLSQAALAKQSANDPQCAARFELFFQGIELANGYDELLDANELLRRTAESNRKRSTTQRQTIAPPDTLVQCMRDGLPQCAGVALGVDRLLMLRCNANQIDQVIPFTIDRA